MQRLLSPIVELHKNGNQRGALHRPDLLKCYFDPRIDFQLEFRPRGASQWNPVRFNSIFDRPRILHGRRGRKFDAESRTRIVVLGYRDAIAHYECVADYHK